MTRLFAGTPWDQPPRCPRCGELEDQCQCPPPPRQFKDPATQTARVRVERRSRGKSVTVVDGLPAPDNDLDELLSALKGQIGAGGTRQPDGFEIQGDQSHRVRAFLSERGYRVR